MLSVTVERIGAHDVIYAQVDHSLDVEDVRHAFQQASYLIKQLNKPVFVKIVMEKHVRFPMSETVNYALPVFQDERIVSWLVTGGNSLVRAVESTLYHMTQRSNVMWFDSEDEIDNYLLASENASV